MRARGYTLVELVVAMLVSTIAIGAGVTLLIASQRWFQSGADDRAMQETARVAMDELTDRIGQAGYGLEPSTAFDFGVLATTAQDRLPRNMTPRFGGYGCQSGACPGLRDSASGPDEMVFYARDPRWARNVESVGPNSLTLQAPANASRPNLYRGQVLQVMCYGGSNQWIWAYVTVESVDGSNAAQPVVTLQAGSAADFGFQNDVLAQPCFSAGANQVRAFKIDRYRYYIAAIDDAGSVQDWETPGARPYLMLDQGLSKDGNPILTAIAPDVEDLQVAYVFPKAENGQVLGASSGVPVTADTTGQWPDDDVVNLVPTPLAIIPFYSASSQDLERASITHHPANIRAVRVAITVRSPRSDIGVGDAKVPAALNRPELDGEKGYRRMVFETTVTTPNMETLLAVFPTYDTNHASDCCPTGGTCDGNCGGG